MYVSWSGCQDLARLVDWLTAWSSYSNLVQLQSVNSTSHSPHRRMEISLTPPPVSQGGRTCTESVVASEVISNRYSQKSLCYLVLLLPDHPALPHLLQPGPAGQAGQLQQSARNTQHTTLQCCCPTCRRIARPSCWLGGGWWSSSSLGQHCGAGCTTW